MPGTPEEIQQKRFEAFLAEPRNVMVAAIRPDGRPQMTPNWFVWDGQHFLISTTKTRRKFPNFTRDPRVQLAVDDSTGYRALLIDGTVAINDDIQAQLPIFRSLIAKHNSQVPADDALLERLQREQRVVLVVTPEKPLMEWTRWGF